MGSTAVTDLVARREIFLDNPVEKPVAYAL